MGKLSASLSLVVIYVALVSAAGKQINSFVNLFFSFLRSLNTLWVEKKNIYIYFANIYNIILIVKMIEWMNREARKDLSVKREVGLQRGHGRAMPGWMLWGIAGPPRGAPSSSVHRHQLHHNSKFPQCRLNLLHLLLHLWCHHLDI